ncbi:MAG TPA: SDR family oxidoreductase [Ilumatobacteraceae bacterium]|nr:SDR family oxidoreductase [Ilumatobacteraceae bacterium]
MAATESRRPTALVTGASRGVGKGIALALARHGYDVAITARTVHEGTGIDKETGAALPGSLDTTAALIVEAGGRAVPVAMDLLQLDTLEASVDRAIDGLGGQLDMIVNNAIYAGGGNDGRLLDSSVEDLVNRVTGNLTAQLIITRHAVRAMLGNPVAANGLRGTVIDITSSAGQHTPKKPAGEGGYSMSYAATKAGFHRIADMLMVEYGDQGIRAINICPGFVATEKVLANDRLAYIAKRGATPDDVGECVMSVIDDSSLANGSFVLAQDYLTN